MTDLVFKTKENDTHRNITAQLKHEEDGTATAVDLTECTVKFYMKRRGYEDKKIDGENATITDVSNGYVTYEWSDTDLDTPGVYECEFVVTYSDSSQETFPSTEDNLLVIVEESL